jgi:MazG family protein
MALTRKISVTAKAYEELLRTLETLLSPDGCAWDRAQSVETTARYLIEEAYEFYDAVATGEADEMTEELGDVIYVACFIGLLARREGRFSLEDALVAARAKMRRRHPHVFAEDGPELEDAEAVIRNWEKIKHGEEAAEGAEPLLPLTRALERVPPKTPPLLLAVRLAEKAAHYRFDWPDIAGVLGKIEEEFAELRESVKRGGRAEIEDELGDLLFTVANLGRFLEIDPGLALRRTLEKFRRRIRRMESELAARGRRFNDCGFAELDEAWRRAKRDDGNRET